MELCAHCDKIDFRAAGLHAPGDPNYNFFSMDDVALLDVVARRDKCSFCEIVSRAFFEWAHAAYGGFERLSLQEARVGYAAELTKRLHEDEDDEFSDDGENVEDYNDNNDNDCHGDSGDDGDDPPLDFSNLFRISVSYTVRNLDGEDWLALVWFFKSVPLKTIMWLPYSTSLVVMSGQTTRSYILDGYNCLSQTVISSRNGKNIALIPTAQNVGLGSIDLGHPEFT